MKCIKFHSPLLPFYSSDSDNKHVLTNKTKFLRLTSNKLCRSIQQSLHYGSPSPVMTNASLHSIVVAASTPKSVDMSTFLQTSALLLFLYFTANFIVPELISKYFGFEKVDKKQKADDVTEDR